MANGTFMDGDWNQIVKSVCSIPFHRQGHGVLWFMYTITGLYLITPIISPWLENVDKKTLQVYLGIWSVTLFFPILRQFLEVEESAFGVLYYFSGFSGYFVFGFYLRKFGFNIKWWAALVMLGGMMIVPVITKLFLPEFDTTYVYYYLSIVCLIMVALWWNILKPLGEKLQTRPKVVSVITEISKMSFGIYLSHILVMKYFLCHTQFVLGIDNYIMQTFTITLLTIIGATTLTYIIGYLPYGEYIIGYKHGKGSK
jgi:surface polysaccharide O-acyltransferase-like enzyme